MSGPDHSGSLLQITSALADAVTAAQVYEAIVDRSASALGATSCGLWLVDGSSLRLARYIGYSAAAAAAFAQVPIDTMPRAPMLDAYHRRKPIWIASQRALLEEYPHVASAATQGAAYRVSCLPLMADGVALGTLGLTMPEERETSESERTFLRDVARYASQALERLRLLDAERRTRQRADAIAKRLTILAHTARVFGRSDMDEPQQRETIVREIGTLLDASTTIALVRPDRTVGLVATYHPNPAADALLRELAEHAPLSAGEGATGKVIESGDAILMASVDPATLSANAPQAYRGFFAQHPAYAAMIAPMRVQGRIIGAVSTIRVRAGQVFDSEDLQLLVGLADRAAAAIENQRLHRESVAARRRAEQLYAFANAVVAAETLEQVFDAALGAICEALQTDRASILLFDSAGVMRFRAWRGLSDAYRAAVEGHSPWSPDTVGPEPLLVSDYLADPALAPYGDTFRAEDIRGLSFIPLVNRGALLGKFMVYYREPHTFTASDVDTARAIANHLAAMVARFRTMDVLERTIRDNELFAGALAHDLRNPLSAILTAAQLVLMNDALEERVRKPLTRIVTSTERMTRMIDQLLDFTRASLGDGISVIKAPVNLVDIAKQVVVELELIHRGRTIVMSSEGDCTGSWDADRLMQVVSNLASNACQHGAADSPVRIVIDGRTPEHVSLLVHNRGTIPQALMPHLFAPFRGGPRRHSNASGLGLGLYIVREIVRAHGGTIEATSDGVEGTTFLVRLPRG